MTRRGAFVVVEGLDRSGKTTQAEIMRRRIQEGGREVVCIKFPGEFHLSDLFSFPLIFLVSFFMISRYWLLKTK